MAATTLTGGPDAVAQLALLGRMARAGSGQVATFHLARSLTDAPLLGRPERLGLRGTVELGGALRRGLSALTAEWGLGREGAVPGFEADVATAEHWSGVLMRDLASAARRALSRPGEAIDVGLLAVALTQAAEAEAAQVDSKMDALQDIWAMAEMAEMGEMGEGGDMSGLFGGMDGV